MTDVPSSVLTDSRRNVCDGTDGIRPGPGFRPSALGHPRVWIEIDEKGYADCGYCDRRFVLRGSPAERGRKEVMPGELPELREGPVD